MQAPLTSLLTAMVGIVLVFFAVEKGTLLYEEYVMQALIIEKDGDFLRKCQTAEGYASMNHHPNFCEKIIATARVGAFWHAVNRVAGSLPLQEALQRAENVSWKVIAATAACFLIMPSFFIRYARMQQESLPYYARPPAECHRMPHESLQLYGKSVP